MITHHTTLLNALIEKYGLRSYLEIGVQDTANNFDKIKIQYKAGVDPEVVGVNGIHGETSDEFFNKIDVRYYFDLIFIDGLHHADQVKRDFENSLRCLSANGFIVIHDVLPENEEGTIVPRQTKQWWGDVYKFAMAIGQYDGIDYKTFNIDNGCMIVTKRPSKAAKLNGWPLTWETYKLVGKELMNVQDEVII